MNRKLAYDYENKLVETIQYMVDNAVAAAPYDKTIQCTIVSCEDESTAKYKVRYQDAIFYAFGTDVDTVYSDNSNVYVLVPGNDFSREKTILGEVNKLGEGYMSLVDDEVLYFPIGGNIVTIGSEVDQSLFNLWTYTEDPEKPGSQLQVKEIPIIDSEATLEPGESWSQKIRIDNKTLKQNLAQASYIKLGANFSVNIPLEQQADLGNYGIIFTIKYKTNTGIEDEFIERTYSININDIVNNPYGLNSSLQSLFFQIDGKNFQEITGIKIYCKDFPNVKNHSSDPEVAALEYDITIKDFVINAYDKIDESKLNGPWVTIVFPDGNSFDDSDIGQSKNIRVNTYKGTEQINPKSNKLQYFWFVEDARVDPNDTHIVGNLDPDVTQDEQKTQTYFDAFYSKYGGYGWKCLNTYHIHIEEQDTGKIDEHGQKIFETIYLKEWDSRSDSLRIEEERLVAKETKYKCVVLYNEYLMSDVRTIINYNAKYDINLTTDTGETVFYFDTGDTTLSCSVEWNGSGTEPSGTKTYIWNKTNHLGEITYLNDVITENYKIYIVDIFNFATYTCFVYKDGIPIGHAAITITNSLESGGQYSLVITNGTQVYKYNEYGLAPNEGSTDEPIVIQPLGYILYDMLGKEVRHDIIADPGKEWLIPAEKSMLEFDLTEEEKSHYYNADGSDYTTEDEAAGKQKWYKKAIIEKGTNTEVALPYTIKDRYDYKCIYNTVRLRIKYQGSYFIAETNFVFTKEGENGTNGSEYFCRIVPNVNNINNIDTSKPLIIIDNDYNNANQDLKFCNNGKSISSSELSQSNILKAELWRNGKRVIGISGRSDNKIEGVSTENISYKLEWEFLQNQYRKNYIYDYAYLGNEKYTISGTTQAWKWVENKYYAGNTSNPSLTDNFYLGKIAESPFTYPFANAVYKESENGAWKTYYNAPALIAKCTFKYLADSKNKTSYYATYPLIWVKTTSGFRNSYPNCTFDLEGGFLNVIYAADGRKPQYHDDPFKIIIYNQNGENISDDFDFQWRNYGGLYEIPEGQNTKQWNLKEFLKETNYSNEQLSKNEKRYKPSDTYDGHCVNSIIECRISKGSGTGTLAIMQIPVHMMLNRYGHAALNDWDGNSISIDKNGNGVILAPQVGAGEKDENNGFTGVLMRKSKRGRS